MPAHVSSPYDTYREELSQGVLCPAGVPCSCCGRACLRLTRSTVLRSIKLFRVDAYGLPEVVAEIAQIAMALCEACGARIRLLPCDVPSYKRYAFPVIESVTNAYTGGDRGLRPVAWDVYGEGPAHTTLHAWSEGMGAWWDGRPAGEMPGTLPASRVEREAEARVVGVEAIRKNRFAIDPRRYRSEGRRERLAACTRLLAVCVQIVAFLKVERGPVPVGLTELARLALVWCASFPIGFRTGLLNTGSEHPARSVRASWDRKEALACSIPGRSPPGASR